MWPDWVSNPGPLTYESGVLPIALRGLARLKVFLYICTGQLKMQSSLTVKDLLQEEQILAQRGANSCSKKSKFFPS